MIHLDFEIRVYLNIYIWVVIEYWGMLFAEMVSCIYENKGRVRKKYYNSNYNMNE